MSEPKFPFYSVVQVLETDTALEYGIVGEEGVVLGMSTEDDTGVFWYGVLMDALDGSIMLAENELRDTGKRVSREDIYSGESIHVRPNGELSPTDPDSGPDV